MGGNGLPQGRRQARTMPSAWDGNLTSDGVRSYSYDHANRLTQVTQGSVTAEYVYNGDGVRTSKTVAGDTTEYALDLLATLPAVISDTDAVYLYGLDIIAQQQTERLYYMHDGLGSVRQLVDTTGQVEANYAYDPFGVAVVEGDESNPYRYTGEAWDAEVELLYLRARYYQPEVGRFITKDPWAGDTWRPGTLGGYVYVLDNPVNRADPTGRQETEPTPPRPETEEEFKEWLEDVNERPLWYFYAYRCDVPTAPEQEPLPEMSAINPGVGLVFQRTVVSPQHSVSFWVVYGELVEGIGYVPAVAGGVVKSGVELTVKVYLNGTFVDIYDTYDTTNLWPLAQALESGPTVYRSVLLGTNSGEVRGPIRFTNVRKERSGFRIGPLNVGGGPEEPEPLQNAQVGEKGRGHVYGNTWFTADEGMPRLAVMRIVVPELAGGMPAVALGDSLSYGPVGLYEVAFGHIYPSH
jgi:RHS repeat-associated protein